MLSIVVKIPKANLKDKEFGTKKRELVGIIFFSIFEGFKFCLK